MQGRNHKENLGFTSAIVGKIGPPGWDRVRVSENLGATSVATVAPVVTSLHITRFFPSPKMWVERGPSVLQNWLMRHQRHFLTIKVF